MTKQEAIRRLKENPLDRERWIDAGKAMGWGKNSDGVIVYRDWLKQWHNFIDHLAEGKTAEDFFANLEPKE